MKFLILIFIVHSAFCNPFAFRNVYNLQQDLFYVGDDVGDPAFLTPYIESGQISIARNISEVRGIFGDLKSYSGYFTVNKTYNSNLFFWYFPAEKNEETAPVILWLQGGPGGSSLYGLFEEHGPLYVAKDGTLKKREHFWSQVFNVIYIDNPVGTGFSFTGREEGYARDEIRVGDELYSSLIQFFKLFPHLQKNEFYVSGESYAGKYVPAVAYAIHKNNGKAKLKINLQGLAIGNGFSDPERMTNYGDYLYHIGLVDVAGRSVLKNIERDILTKIQQGNYEEATIEFYLLMDSYFNNLTGFSNVYNYLHENTYSPNGDLDKFLQKANCRSRIHVGNLTYHSGDKVALHLQDDFMRSVKPWIEELLEHYRILFYSGQLDIIVAYPLTLNFLQSLEWSGKELYKTAPRKEWRVGTDLAGYSKTAKLLTEVLVRNAGHMVPADQPRWALDLITRFAFNKDF